MYAELYTFYKNTFKNIDSKSIRMFTNDSRGLWEKRMRMKGNNKSFNDNEAQPDYHHYPH